MLRLTPVDILNKRFSRRFSGYHPGETDAFLREIAADLEAALVENAALREQLAASERETARYHALEGTMRDALLLGQKAADEIRDAARAQAAAQIEAAQQRVEALGEQLERLRLDRRRMAHEMRALLESQMAWLDYEISRDSPQIAVALSLASSAASDAIESVKAGAEKMATAKIGANPDAPGFASYGVVSPLTSAEYAALNDRADAEESRLSFESQDRTAPRNGAPEALPSENA